MTNNESNQKGQNCLHSKSKVNKNENSFSCRWEKACWEIMELVYQEIKNVCSRSETDFGRGYNDCLKSCHSIITKYNADKVDNTEQMADKDIISRLFDAIYEAECELTPDVDQRLRNQGLDPDKLVKDGQEFLANLKEKILPTPHLTVDVPGLAEDIEEAACDALVSWADGTAHVDWEIKDIMKIIQSRLIACDCCKIDDEGQKVLTKIGWQKFGIKVSESQSHIVAQYQLENQKLQSQIERFKGDETYCSKCEELEKQQDKHFESYQRRVDENEKLRKEFDDYQMEVTTKLNDKISQLQTELDKSRQLYSATRKKLGTAIGEINRLEKENEILKSADYDALKDKNREE